MSAMLLVAESSIALAIEAEGDGPAAPDGGLESAAVFAGPDGRPDDVTGVPCFVRDDMEVGWCS